MSECVKLAQTLAEQSDGRKVVDVKFYVQNPAAVSHERLCGEVNRVTAALKSGDFTDVRLPQI